MLSHSTDLPPGPDAHEWELAVRPVKIELLDGDRQSLGQVATGFFLKEDASDCFLYLPWHVVSGYNYPNVTVSLPPDRRFIKVISKDVTSGQSGNYSLGGVKSTVIPLYSEEGIPLWIQEQMFKPQHDLERFNIRVPRYTDLVALPVEMDANSSRFLCFTPAQLSNASVQNGQEIVIVGFPFGYSALGALTPEPLFLTRHVASWVMEDRPHDFLIDGAGAQGMSGSPIFIRTGNLFKLIGVYTAAVFPDATETGRMQDAYSTLGVGVRVGSRAHFSTNRDYFLAPDCASI